MPLPNPYMCFLLILCNHHSHMSLRGIDFCWESGIILFSYPQHCSHKLQPLDRSVFDPFKKMGYTFSDSWMRHHPGTTMSIYHIPAIVRDSFPMAATPSNIQGLSSGAQAFGPSSGTFSAMLILHHPAALIVHTILRRQSPPCLPLHPSLGHPTSP